MEGSPLITGTKYTAERLRCSLCAARYQTSWPDSIKNTPKYDVSCATTLAIGRYSIGLPMYRIEHYQAMHGIPMADATQYDLLRSLYNVVSPVHDALIEQAANGSLVIYDDTPGRILDEQALGKVTHTTQ